MDPMTDQTLDQYQTQTSQQDNPEDWDLEYLTGEAILDGLGSLHPFARPDPNIPIPPIPRSFQRSYNDI